MNVPLHSAMMDFTYSGLLFKSVEVCSKPCSHLIGQMILPEDLIGKDAFDAEHKDLLCAYGRGSRREHQTPEDRAQPNQFLSQLEKSVELRAFALEYSKKALGLDLSGENIAVHARRYSDQIDYYLSPHADCPKTICAFIIYLWNGERGTSFYRLRDHSIKPPVAEQGLQRRVNNFSGNIEYQRANLDVISQVKSDCFAYFEHVKVVPPAIGSFLFIPNTRFRDALPDLPPSYHGVSSKSLNVELDERRELILIDVKVSLHSKGRLRSIIKSRVRQKINQAKAILAPPGKM